MLMVIVAREHELAGVIEQPGLGLALVGTGHELDADLVLALLLQTRERLVMGAGTVERHALGLDPRTEYVTRGEQPHKLVKGGELVSELF